MTTQNCYTGKSVSRIKFVEVRYKRNKGQGRKNCRERAVKGANLDGAFIEPIGRPRRTVYRKN